MFTPAQARALWATALDAACSDERVHDDAEVYRYLAGRGLMEAWELRLIGVLTREAADAHGRMGWYATGHRLLAPLFDAGGSVANVQARCIFDHPRKVLFAPGSHAKSALFANSSAQLLLRAETPGCGAVVYGEGLTDFLALSIVAPCPVLAAPGTPFVADGVGSWARNADVFLAVDNDRAGDKTLERTAERCFEAGARRVVRVRWPDGCIDACDALSLLGAVGFAGRVQRLITEGPYDQ
jgi:hypothetical protein